MVKIYKILIVLMLVISFSIYLKGQYISEVDCKKDSFWKPFSDTVIIQNLIQLENLINKELPTIGDMINFNMGYEDPYEKDLSCGFELLENLENWGFTKEEYELITKEYSEKNPSCYLMRVQKLLKKDSKGPVKIYIPLKQSACYKIMRMCLPPCYFFAKDINAIIKVDGKYKEVTFKMACNKASVSSWGNLIDIKVNNQWMNPDMWKHSYEELLEEEKKK